VSKQLINISGVENLSILGSVTFDGNHPAAEQKEFFLRITSPEKGGGVCKLGSLSMACIARSGVLLESSSANARGYDKITLQEYDDINGVGCGDLKGSDIITGFGIRGGHRTIIVDKIRIRNDDVNWTRGDTLPNYKNFSVSAEVDPDNYPRPDSLYIGSLQATCAASGFYTQAVSKIHLHEVIFDSSLRKPGVKDQDAYSNVRHKVYAFYKASWGSHKTPGSSFRVDKYVIRNTNPALLGAENFMVGLWFNTGTHGAVVDTLETDMPFALGPDGQYPGIVHGGHRIKTLILNQPSKPSFVQGLEGEIGKVILGKGQGAVIGLSACHIGEITQLGTGQVMFLMQQRNVYDSSATLPIHGLSVDKCTARNIKWQFYFHSDSHGDGKQPSSGYAYKFHDFTGKNIMQVFVIRDGQMAEANKVSPGKDVWLRELSSCIHWDLKNAEFTHNSDYPGEMTYLFFGDDGAYRKSGGSLGSGPMKPVFHGNSIQNTRFYKPVEGDKGVRLQDIQ
jgi:hypothetical protein